MTVSRTVINRRSGSSFDLWLRMGGLELEDSAELQTLRMHAAPQITKYRVSTQDHTLELNAMLEMLEVRLIEVRRDPEHT